MRWARKVGPSPAATDDVDEREVHDPKHHRVEDQPQLAERRVEVLSPQVRARELDEELAPLPESAEVGSEWR